MRKKDWIMDVLIGIAALALILAMLLMAVTAMQAATADEQAREIMAQAQERIDAYYAALPVWEQPVVVSAVPVTPVVTVDNPPPALRSDSPLEKGAEETADEWYIEDLPLDRELQNALWIACQEFGIDYPLALAVIEQETRFQNLIGDDGNAIGYFQVQPYWWGDLLDSIGVDDLTDPVQNFRAGCAVLRYLLDINDGSVTDALTAYNPGYRNYAESVLERAEGYQ